MRLTAIIFRVSTVLLFAACVTAQIKPDFSGRWTVEPEPTTAESREPGQPGAERGGRGRASAQIGSMGSGWGQTLTITQDARRLTVEYPFFVRGDMQPPLKFVYALDGSETKNSVMMGRGIQVQTSKTSWDGEKLVITTLHSFAHPETGQPLTSEVRHTLSLASPASLIIETTRSGVLGGQSSTTRTTYTKTNDK